MQLFTIQPYSIVTNFLEEGLIYRPSKSQCLDTSDPFFDTWDIPYAWIRQQLISYSKYVPTSPDHYPLWAWPKGEGLQLSSDLRTSFFRDWTTSAPGSEYAVIDFEEDASQVLVSGYDAWHFPLNKWYLASSEEDADSFERLAKEKGFNCFGKPHVMDNPELKKLVLGSWLKIFDKSFNAKFTDTTVDNVLFQAVTWQLNPNKVTRIRKFKPRSRSK